MTSDAGTALPTVSHNDPELGHWVNDWPVAQDSIYGFLGLNWTGEPNSTNNGPPS